MAVFAYKAFDLDTAAVVGTIVADTPREARDQLRGRGLNVQSVEVKTQGKAQASRIPHLWGRRRRVRSCQVVDLVRELSTLLGVGIPLLESLDTITRQHRGAVQTTVLQLRDAVSSGISLADAMRDQPAVFDGLCISITDVGEQAGNLDVVLDQLALFKERSQALRGRVGTALIYPLIVLLIGLGVGVFLMTFVVPKLLDALVESGRDLPWATSVVKNLSDFLTGHWLILLLGFAGVIVTSVTLLKTARGRKLWHVSQLKLPGVGVMIRKQAIVRISMVVSTLMRSGIVFERAIRIAAGTTTNLLMRDALLACEEAVLTGKDIAFALETTKAFPPAVVQIFAIGQQSGRLEDMLDRLAKDYDRQVNTATQRLAAALEPVLILLLAGIVGFIAFATVLPILQAGQVL